MKAKPHSVPVGPDKEQVQVDDNAFSMSGAFEKLSMLWEIGNESDTTAHYRDDFRLCFLMGFYKCSAI